MITQSLNGIWRYRVGKGVDKDINVPFSCLPVGHSECFRIFDLEKQGKIKFLKFEGITYYAKVYLNDVFLGEMGPYCEYLFDITDTVKEKDNSLLVEIEDISPLFGPTAGWENFGGIIRNVEVVYYEENYIKDVFFYSSLINDYKDADFTVEYETKSLSGEIQIELLYNGEIVFHKKCSVDEADLNGSLKNVFLWSPESPQLYDLRVSLFEDGKVIDVYSCRVGFREFTCEKHRFLLNGKPLFLKGVCKHEMFGDSGHCPNEEQMRYDMRMIKDTGCNFVRLVHYPHNKRILEIADELGLMVSEEPGLWWSDTSVAEVSEGSLEVLRRTVLRDRNHPSIVFWLSFNECKFTKQYLIDSADTCRSLDPTRLVSGANCMSNEDTLKYFNICGFDFYTMHPYSDTIDRAVESAKILNDKPLLFTEWGGFHVYDNPKLLGDFLNTMYELYLANSDSGALAGAFFWEWSEINDFNRGKPACIDGNLAEGLVNKYRKPRLIYRAFCNVLAKMDEEPLSDFWIDYESNFSVDGKYIPISGKEETFADIVSFINESEIANYKMRRRILKNGPLLKAVQNCLEIPMILQDGDNVVLDCDINTEKISFIGMTSIVKGYPLGGIYSEAVAKVTIIYDDNEQRIITLRNGEDITTIFALNNSSRIDPIAENAKRIAKFGYDKNFEYYILNQIDIQTEVNKKIKSIVISSENNGYALCIYGITY